ncbi:HRDC domain-containing protein [Gordonia alkaliphila]|uniref:HRDC domain-containing protein n=1 Tax=Gordonia alkaliphila TaxID=1053547 RepID=UPI001FF28A6B|nr:HRDC domain-containing protein [Gordonia alkaliphila]MCK0440500.1 HRDC domain-containing protein [Gordonia alkaliphila]
MSEAGNPDPGQIDEAQNPIRPLLAPADGVPDLLSTPEQFERAAELLDSGTGPIALDTERASGYRYSQRAYLIQVRRTGAGSFLIDPIEHPEALAPLVEVLDGPEWILHAADQDLPCLTELNFRCATLFDTELAGRLLNLPKVNLAAMVAEFLQLGLAKGHGAADWSHRPLPDEWLNYAALDVEVLVELRDAMTTALDDAGRLDWAAQEFAYELVKPAAPPRTDRWRRTSNLHTLRTSRQLAIVRSLWTAREQVAARRDVAPGRVLPDSAIITAATAAPTTEAALTRLPVFGGPRQRRQAKVWMGAIADALALSDADLPPRKQAATGPPPLNRWEQRNPDAARRAHEVRPALKELAETTAVPMENMLAPDTVRELCWQGLAQHQVADVDTWLAGRGARPWQRDLTGQPIAEALSRASDPS